MTTRADVIAAVAAYAPPQLQESWDNSGVQLGLGLDAPCTGVLLCVDVTPDVVAEARSLGCNLIVSHHPLIFKGLRSITGSTPVERAVADALRADIAVYSAHTSLDSAPGGISHEMAAMLGARVTAVLAPQAADPSAGLGVVAELAAPMAADDFAALCAATFGAPHLRRSAGAGRPVSRVALCGGSGGEFIGRAEAAGADAYVTGDIRYHDFVDHGRRLLLLDVGHFESESCAKSIFYRVITEKIPNFAVHYSNQHNPVQYL